MVVKAKLRGAPARKANQPTKYATKVQLRFERMKQMIETSRAGKNHRLRGRLEGSVPKRSTRYPAITRRDSMNAKPTIVPRRLDSSGAPTARLSEVDIRAELAARPHPAPNFEAEQKAMVTLAKEMSENPRNMLQKLTQLAIELCDADTAGISLLETDEEDVFRWEALSGVFAPFRSGTMPRNASPCGICVDQDTFQLMHLPDRCFPALRTEPRFVEALLIPFHVSGRPIGTIWIVSHQTDKRFDREDERIISSLAHFASAGWQFWKASDAAAAARISAQSVQVPEKESRKVS
jgi:hypothetical protein